VAKTTKPKLPSLKYFTVVYLALPINGSSRSMLAYVCVMWGPSLNFLFQRPTGSVQSSIPDPVPAAPRCHEHLTDPLQNLCRRLHVRENPHGKAGKQVLYKAVLHSGSPSCAIAASKHLSALLMLA
jgi:hypothetical protein